MKKVRINQRKTFDEVRIDHYKKVRIDHWLGSELTKGQGPNSLGPNNIESELTRAELAKVRIVLLPHRQVVCVLFNTQKACQNEWDIIIHSMTNQ